MLPDEEKDMRRTVMTGVLIGLWLVSFLLCLFIPFYFRRDIPSSFNSLIKQTFDTFSQTLAAMIGFVFANRQNKTSSNQEGNQSLFADILAIVLSLAYVGIFDTIMLLFATSRLRADETVTLFQDYKPYFAFLVAGVVAYYFGSHSAQSINGTGGDTSSNSEHRNGSRKQ